MSFPLKRSLRLAALFALLLAASLYGQTLGTITGEVRDASGAAIPAANINVRNIATNGQRVAVTNTAGAYTIPALQPGTYEVKAEKTGFKLATHSNIILQVQQTARVDFKLEVGAVTESVEVTSQLPLLETSNATVGTVVEQRGIQDLPLNGRSFLSLVSLAPNVTSGFSTTQQAPGRQGGTRSNVTISMAGGRSTWSNYTLDGLTDTDVNFNLYILLPSVEALQEFKVQSGIFPAEFGRAPGQVNVSTKGGTNEYHGSAFEFLRNDKLDARPYFFKDPESPTQTAPLKAPYRQNQYGFTLSGPLQIPKVINGKDKLFFMVNYEGYKSRRSSPSYFTSMTQDMRNGDFSVVNTTLYDPKSRVKQPDGTSTAVPFQGNQIPTTEFNPAGVYIVNTFSPLPNLPQTGVPTRNYQYTTKNTVDRDQFTARLDFNESANSQWFGRYSWTGESTLSPGVKLNGTVLDTRASQWMVSNTRVFSASKINEFRFGYTSMFNNITQELASVENVNEKIGTALPVSDPNSWGIPNISLENSTLSGFGNSANGPFLIDDKYYEFMDNFSWIAGKHSFRFGGEYRYNQFLQVGNEFARGRFTANGNFTADPNTLAGGYNGADFLMGNLSAIEVAVALAQGDFRNSETSLYIDDTYKVTPHLTLNWGLRYELVPPYIDDFGKSPNFQIRQALPDIANVPDANLHPVMVRTGNGDFYEDLLFRFDGPVQLARDGRLGNRLIDTDYNDFAPRIGLAYSPSPNWAVRAGFGVFYSRESANSIFDLNRATGGRLNTDVDWTGVPTKTFDNYVDANALPVHFTPGLTWGVDSHIRTSYVLQYILNVQRQLGDHTSVELGYFGNGGRKLAYLRNANAPIPGITSYGSREPYPEWYGIQFQAGDAVSSYNAFSAKLTERFGTNLNALFSYTWSKALAESDAIRGTSYSFTLENQRCRACDYGYAAYDVPQRLSASIMYALPFGKGQRFLNTGGVVNQVLGGWNLSTITTIQSGEPLNTGSWDSAGMGAGFPHSNRLNCVAGVDPVYSNPTSDGYFNPAAFTNVVAGEFGDCGRGSLRAPRKTNIDFSVRKVFQITEQHRVEFRMEMFNAPNHPAWGSPNSSWGSSSQTPSRNFGRIRSTINLREIQFALKYSF